MGGKVERPSATTPDDALEVHHHASEAEAVVLRLVRRGLGDDAIATALNVKVRTVEARLHRFYARTKMSGRLAVIWTADHFDCCLGSSDEDVVLVRHGELEALPA